MGRTRDLIEAAPSPVASNPIRVARHAVGSAYILARTAVRVPSCALGAADRIAPPSLPGRVWSRSARACPSSIGSFPGAGRTPGSGSPPTTSCSGGGSCSGARPAPYLALPEAVRASCAIPGVYTPVHVGDTVLVDGGVWSLTNLDLALAAGCDVAVCVAPLVYDPEQPPPLASRIDPAPHDALAGEGGGHRPPRRASRRRARAGPGVDPGPRPQHDAGPWPGTGRRGRLPRDLSLAAAARGGFGTARARPPELPGPAGRSRPRQHARARAWEPVLGVGRRDR